MGLDASAPESWKNCTCRTPSRRTFPSLLGGLAAGCCKAKLVRVPVICGRETPEMYSCSPRQGSYRWGLSHQVRSEVAVVHSVRLHSPYDCLPEGLVLLVEQVTMGEATQLLKHPSAPCLQGFDSAGALKAHEAWLEFLFHLPKRNTILQVFER